MQRMSANPSGRLLFLINFQEKFSTYLFQLILQNKDVYAIKSSESNKITSLKIRHNFFKHSFFPTVIIGWNNLDTNIQNSCSINVLRKNY